MPLRKACSILSAAALCGCGHIHEQSFYVSGASLQESEHHQRLLKTFESRRTHLTYDDKEFVVTGHRIAQGRGTVLAFRSYDPGNPLIADQAGFFKITVYVPTTSLKGGQEFPVPGPDGALAFYSTGSSNFPGSGGCFGYASEGSMRVLETSATTVTVKADLHFRLSGPAGTALSDCADKRIEATYKAQARRVEELTPWQGAAGQNIYEETIAR